MRVLWLVVNYNSHSETIALCRNLAAVSQDVDLTILVVDNSEKSSDWSVIEQLRVASVVRPEKNLGYFGGANYGLSQFLKEHPPTDYVVVSNTDLKVDADFFRSLLKTQSYNIGVIGPKIWIERQAKSANPQYLTRPSAKKMRRLCQLFSNPISLNAVFIGYYLLRAIKTLTGNSTSQVDTEQAVYSVHGSCMVFTKLFFDRGGTLNHPCFLFGEEIFVAEQCRQMSLEIRYIPSLKVIHDEHKTTGFFRSGALARYQAESARTIYERYFSNSTE